MTKVSFWLSVLVVGALALVALGRRGGAALQVGGLYSVENGKGGYVVAKILVLDPSVVHVRVYREVFSSRPVRVDESALTLGSLRDPKGFGMGHLPLSRRTFAAWKPQFIKLSTVTAEERDLYEAWKKSGGGLWQ
jgi:hypothetical protein